MLKTIYSANTAVIALSVVALAAEIPSSNVAAETSTRELSCRTMLRVVGVTSDDVLFLRDSPSLPEDHHNSNKLVGIPAGAHAIQALGEATDGWRLVRYMGVVGYARSNYLIPDITICSLQPNARQSQSRQDSRYPAFR